MKIRTLVAILFTTSTSVFLGCEKDELTKPVNVKFLVELNSGEKYQSYVSFNGGIVTFSKITFEGHREEGSDVNFESKPGFDFGNIRFDTIYPGTVAASYDIPQGIYNFMKWGIKFSQIDLGEQEFEAESAGLILEGTYTSIASQNIPVCIVVSSFEELNVQAANPSGTGSITLADEQRYNATLTFDMNYVLSSISRESFESAEVENEGGETFIEISTNSNESLYQLILFRIQNSAKITIE